MSIYFVLVHAWSIGAFDGLESIGKLTTNDDLTGQINMYVACKSFTYQDGNAVCTVEITNNGQSIANLSEGDNPIHLGISIVDKNGNIICQDYLHSRIKNGTFKNGQTVSKELKLSDLESIRENDYLLRFEIVQEGISWIDSTATYYDYGN